MKITLTGATGFIGTLLVERLKRAGHELTIVTRKVREGTNPRYAAWDARDAFEGCDAVIHLAGEPVAQRWTPAVKARIRNSRVEGTRRLVETLASLERKPRVMVAASAIGIYGSRGEETLTEASAPGVGFLPDVSRDWEREERAATPLGIRVAMIPDRHRAGARWRAEDDAAAVPTGGWRETRVGQQWMSWIHVDDLIELIVFAMEREGLQGPVNGTAPAPVRNEEFTRALAEAIHRPAVFTVPEFALKVMFGEMAGVIMGSAKVLPEAAKRAGFGFRYGT